MSPDGGSTSEDGGTAAPDAASAAIKDGGGSGTPGSVTSQAHRVLYWGDFETKGTFALTLLDMPSKKKTPLSTPPGVSSDDGDVSQDGKHLVLGYSQNGPTPSIPPSLVLHDVQANTFVTLATGGSGTVGIHKPRLSLDGKWVAYEQTTGTSSKAYVVDATGTSAPVALDIPITSGVGRLVWSKQGTLAVGYGTSVALAKLNGASWSISVIPQAADYSAELAFDANGNLYFAGQPMGSAGYHLYRYDAASAQVTAVPEVDALATKRPALTIDDVTISPDGHALAFSADVDAADSADVYALDLSAKSLTQLTHLGTESPAGDTFKLAFRPDSKALAVSVQWNVPNGQSGVTGSILLATLDAAKPVRIDAPQTSWQVEARDLSFSPDGQVLYLRADAITSGAMELFGFDSLSKPSNNPWTARIQSTTGGDVDGLAVRGL